MRNRYGFTAWIFITAMFFSGCAVFNKATETVETHDQVLIYKLPYDLTYLRAMEAVTFLPDWELLETEKEKGLIRLDNVNFGSMTDADRRLATLYIRRVSREETSVQLAPFSQKVLGGDVLLATIDDLISREL